MPACPGRRSSRTCPTRSGAADGLLGHQLGRRTAAHSDRQRRRSRADDLRSGHPGAGRRLDLQAGHRAQPGPDDHRADRGDWSRIAANGEAWRSAGQAMLAMADNLAGNIDELRSHWSGAASDSFGVHVQQVWPAALESQAQVAQLVGKGFDTVAEEGRKLVQEALEELEKLVDKLIEAIAVIWVPFAGWARAVQMVWDAFQPLTTTIEPAAGLSPTPGPARWPPTTRAWPSRCRAAPGSAGGRCSRAARAVPAAAAAGSRPARPAPACS